MPDLDNLSRSFRGAWRNIGKHAANGVEYLSASLAHITVGEIPKSKGLPLLLPLAQQLCQLSKQSSDERLCSTVELPKDAERCRDTEIALHAAQRVHAEIVINDEYPSDQEIVERVCKEFCLELPRVYALGVLEAVAVPAIYMNAEEAWFTIKDCEARLVEKLAETARELASNPSAPTLTRISKPTQKRRSQDELVGVTLTLNKENI